jgi:hypothetical protein
MATLLPLVAAFPLIPQIQSGLGAGALRATRVAGAGDEGTSVASVASDA